MIVRILLRSLLVLLPVAAAVAGILSLCLLSLAGIPATAGFVGKWVVFEAGVRAGLTWLVVIGVLSSAVAAFFYLRIAGTMFLEDPEEGRVPPVVTTGLSAGVSIAAALVLSVAGMSFANEAVYRYRGADRDSRLLENARNEGSVVLYTSLAPTESGPLGQAFVLLDQLRDVADADTKFDKIDGHVSRDRDAWLACRWSSNEPEVIPCGGGDVQTSCNPSDRRSGRRLHAGGRRSGVSRLHILLLRRADGAGPRRTQGDRRGL